MLNAGQLLTGIPDGLRQPLIDTYIQIAQNYAEHRWEPSELNGGKLCEIVFTILDGAISGAYAAKPKKPAKFVEACRSLEQRPSDPNRVGDRSLRIQIPRLLPYLYEIRNNRGVGHVGGDVDPNLADATAVFSCSSWIMAELVRIFHGVTLDQARSAVETLVERKHPLVWTVEDKKRVLDPTLSSADQTLILLYSSQAPIPVEQLRDWVEYRNSTNFRDRILEPLHSQRFIEYDRHNRRVQISPRGAHDIENRILPKYAAWR